MSTKIYYGIIFDIENDGLFAINNLVSEIKNTCLSQANIEFKKTFGQHISDFIDACCCASLPYADQVFELGLYQAEVDRRNQLGFDGVSAASFVAKRMKDPSKQQHFELLDASIVIYPLSGKVLGTYHTPSTSLGKLILSHPKVRSYGYWNNSDKPDNVNQDEWEKRQKDWDQVFSAVSVPSKAGFTYELVSYEDVKMAIYDSQFMDSVIPCIENKEIRASRLAHKFTLSEKLSELESGPGSAGVKLETARKWFESPEAKSRLEHYSSIIKGLIKDISKEEAAYLASEFIRKPYSQSMGGSQP